MIKMGMGGSWTTAKPTLKNKCEKQKRMMTLNKGERTTHTILAANGRRQSN